MSEENSEKNTISVKNFKDFKTTQTEAVPYQSGDMVSRKNFTSLLEKSFAFSKGNPTWQYAYFSWLGDNLGFDWKSTLKNFREAGGWNCLTPAEQESFKSIFNKVKKHEEAKQIFNFAPQNRLRVQLDKLIGPVRPGSNIKLEEDLRAIAMEASYQTFKKLYGTPKNEHEFTRDFEAIYEI